MKKHLIIFVILFFSQFANAATDKWTCPSGQPLNQLFRGMNWDFHPQQQFYFASISYPISNLNFTAALHTKTPTLDSRDPELIFSKIQTQIIKHYQVMQIRCLYQIGNQNMDDMGDGFLYLTGIVPL